MRTVTLPPWYDREPSARTEEEVLADLDRRFAQGSSTDYRKYHTTPLAPPPTGTDDDKPSRSIGRFSNPNKPMPDNFSQRRVERERRKWEPRPEQVDPKDCPHDAGYSRDGMSHGLYRLKCRKCGERKRVATFDEVDALAGARG